MNAAITLVRNRRRAIIVLALLVFVVGAMQSLTYASIAGDTAAERSVFAAQSEALARQLTFLAPPPTDLGTLGGYLTWRVFGSLALVLGLWAVWFAVSTTRGDERDGLTEQILAAGTRRESVVLQAAGAFAIGVTAIVGALCLGIVLTSIGQLSPAGVVLHGVALALVLFNLFALGIVVAQFTTSARVAMVAAGAIAFLLSLINSMSGTIPLFATIRMASPFAWYGATEPLVGGGSFSTSAAALALLFGIALIALAAVLFRIRDLGSAVLLRARARRRVVTPAHARWYSVPVVATLFELRKLLVAWCLGAAALVAFFTAIVPSVVASLQQVDALVAYLEVISGGDVERGVVGLFLLGTLQLYLALVALTFVSRWLRNERDGRLALELSTPVSRAALVLHRAGTVAATSVLVAGVAAALLVVVAPGAGVDVPVAAAARMAAVLVLFALAVAAVGAVLIAAVPRGAVVGLNLFVGVSYFINEVAPLYGWDDRVLNLSVFHLVGNPLVRPPGAAQLAALIVAAVAGFATAAVLLRERDITAA